MRDMRVGVMYYYRTNKKQFGIRNTAVPTSAYTPFSIPIPANSLGVSNVTVYNLASSLASAQNFIRDNEDFLDTKYPRGRVHGVQAVLESLADGRGTHDREEHWRVEHADWQRPAGRNDWRSQRSEQHHLLRRNNR